MTLAAGRPDADGVVLRTSNVWQTAVPPRVAGRTRSVLGELIAAGILCGGFAIFVGFVSMNLDPRFAHRAETIQQQFAILNGQPYLVDGLPIEASAYQNRVLFPIGLYLLSALEMGSPGQWYIVLRLATAVLAFLAFWYLLRRQARADPKLTAMGLGLLGYELVFTFNHGWEHPTDFPDVAFTSLWIAAAIDRERWGVLAIALVAAFNRESAAFAGILWLVLYGFGQHWTLRRREIGFGALVSSSSYLTVLGIRWVVAGPQSFRDNTNVSDIPATLARFREAFTSFAEHPMPWSWPVLLLSMAILPGLWIWVNRSYVDGHAWRMLLAAAVTMLLSLPFSRLEEPRDFMTSIILLVYVAVVVERSARRATQIGSIEKVMHGSISIQPCPD